MNEKLVRTIFKRVVYGSLLVFILIFLLAKDVKASIFGYIFGVLISMLNFLLLKKSIEKSVRMEPSKASGYATGQYFIRMSIQFLVLIIGAVADYLNFLLVILGLLMVKIVINLSTLLDKNYLKKE